MIDRHTQHQIRRMAANGWRLRKIARLLGVPLHEIRRALAGPVVR